METTSSLKLDKMDKSDTKYRVIADGNQACNHDTAKGRRQVRYQVPRYSGWKRLPLPSSRRRSARSDTKYRVIADGNDYN